MSNHHITTNLFVVDGPALQDATGGSLIVDAGVSVKATLGTTISLDGTWTMTINGAVTSSNGIALQLGSSGGPSTLTVGTTGLLSGLNYGLYTGQVLNIVNKGFVSCSSGIAAIHENTSADGNFTIMNSGTIQGGTDGILLGGTGKHTIKNTGTIDANNFAFVSTDATAVDIFKNYGDLEAAIFMGDGNDVFTMFKGTADDEGAASSDLDMGNGDDTLNIQGGTISMSILMGVGLDTVTMSSGHVDDIQLGADADTLTLTGGVISNFVNFGDGANILKVSAGKISNYVEMGSDADEVMITGGILSNYVDLGAGANVFKVTGGTINNYVAMGSGADKVTITGGLFGNSLDLGAGANVLKVTSGTINNYVAMGSGADKVTITGGALKNYIDLGDGANELTMTGGKVSNYIKAGLGTDVITLTNGTSSGKVVGEIDLGGGADTFTGGKYADMVRSGAGNDTVSLGGGKDTYLATLVGGGADGADTVSGSAGKDTWDAGAATTGVTIDLLIGQAVHSAIVDQLSGFENAIGGSAGDVINGTSGKNELNGQGGDDKLSGLNGNDSLFGGTGKDTLTGGGGKDTLDAGLANADADTFQYLAASDSTSAARDTILNFTQSGLNADKIDLDAIDAISRTTAVNDDFTFIGTSAFSHTAGELRYSFTKNGDTIVSGDVNGDGKTDFSLLIKGHFDLTGAEFNL